MKIRNARPVDAPEISGFLTVLAEAGKRTLPSDEVFVRDEYIGHPDTLSCLVAEGDEGRLLGIQILKRAVPGNAYGVTPGWGFIGTHIHPAAARRGVGSALFAASREVAVRSDLPRIDATIGASNEEGLAYYEAMGFRTYQEVGARVRKCYDIE